MAIKFEVTDLIPAAPDTIYNAWLDSKEHSGMTGGQANVSSKVGDTFDAWDGYIQGKNSCFGISSTHTSDLANH